MTDRSLKLEVILAAVDKATAPIKALTGASSKLASQVRAAKSQLDSLSDTERKVANYQGALKSARESAEAYRKAKAAVGEYRTQLEAHKATQQDLAAKTRASRAVVQQMVKSMQQSGTVSAEASARYTMAKHELEKLERAYAKSQSVMRGHKTDLTNAIKASSAAERENRRLASSLRDQATKMREAGLPTKNLAQYQEQLSGNLARANQALSEQKRKLEAVGTQMKRLQTAREAYDKTMETRNKLAGAGVAVAATGAAVGGALAAPIAAYAQAEDAATQLRVAMMRRGGEVADEFDRINELATRLGDRLPGTSADFQNMMTMLIRQGMAPKAILGGLGEATAYLGVQLKLSSEEAAEFAAKLQDATRTTEHDMMGLMDLIQRSFYVGVDKGNMLNAFAKLSPALDTIRMKGLEGARALAPLVAMADQAGMAGEAAGNAMRKVFQRSMDSEHLAIILHSLKKKGINLDIQFTDGKGEFGGLDNLLEQLGKLKGLSTEARLGFIGSIYGDDAEVTQIVSLLIDKGREGYEEMQRKMLEQADIQRRVNEQLGTLRNLWEAATGTFTNALAAIGETISPELKALTNWLGEVASAARNWVKENPAIASGAMKAAGILALVTAGLGALLLAVSAVIGPLAMLKFAMSAFAIAGLKAALVGGVIVAAVALLGTAAYQLYKNWEPIEAWFGGLWDSVQAQTAAALDYFQSLPAHFEKIGLDMMLGLSRGIRNTFGAVKDAVGGAAQGAVDWVKEKLSINSPSRVFAEIGGSTMEGFAAGINRGAGEPLDVIIKTARKLVAAGATAAAVSGPALAGSPATADGLLEAPLIDSRPPISAVAPQSRPVEQVVMNYTVNITAGAGTDMGTLRALFREELDRHKREVESRQRSRLADFE